MFNKWVDTTSGEKPQHSNNCPARYYDPCECGLFDALCDFRDFIDNDIELNFKKELK